MSMKYVSTRGENTGETYSNIVLRGLADDGGLFLPESYPRLTLEELNRFRSLSYGELAYEILKRFADDIPADDLKRLCLNTYTSAVYCNAREAHEAERITPVREFEPETFLLQLSNGPTLAFKDMAMQFLGSLFEYLLAKEGKSLNILGATSGDTGSAAEYAMKGRKGIRVFMLSPYGRMSDFQRAQMYSLQDENIFNIAVKGVFDDAQDIVKAVSNDHAFKKSHSIGTVNSINWARVAAQVVYYVRGYLEVTDERCEEVDVTVPTGNFGNVLAGWIAKCMGVPFAQLVVATNENDVLDEFFRTGTYRVRDSAHTYLTSSPSMDISKASNFERFVYDLMGRNAERVRELFGDVATKGGFTLTKAEHCKVKATGFTSTKSTHAERIRTIRELSGRGLLIDPHTADAVKGAREHKRSGVKMLVLETALPTKFAETIREATGNNPTVPASYADIEQRPQRVTVMEAKTELIKAFVDEHTR